MKRIIALCAIALTMTGMAAATASATTIIKQPKRVAGALGALVSCSCRHRCSYEHPHQKGLVGHAHAVRGLRPGVALVQQLIHQP